MSSQSRNRASRSKTLAVDRVSAVPCKPPSATRANRNKFRAEPPLPPSSEDETGGSQSREFPILEQRNIARSPAELRKHGGQQRRDRSAPDASPDKPVRLLLLARRSNCAPALLHPGAGTPSPSRIRQVVRCRLDVHSCG